MMITRAEGQPEERYKPRQGKMVWKKNDTRNGDGTVKKKMKWTQNRGRSRERKCEKTERRKHESE